MTSGGKTDITRRHERQKVSIYAGLALAGLALAGFSFETTQRCTSCVIF